VTGGNDDSRLGLLGSVIYLLLRLSAHRPLIFSSGLLTKGLSVLVVAASSCNDQLPRPIVDVLATASIKFIIVATLLRQRLHGLLQRIQLVPDVEDLLRFQGAQMTLDVVPQLLQLAIPAHDFGFGALPDTFGTASVVWWADLFEEGLQLIQRLLALLQDGFGAPTGVFFDVVAVLLRPLEKALGDWEFLEDFCELAR
jgi:hypothetical protein